MRDPRNLAVLKDLEKAVRLSARTLKNLRNWPDVENAQPGITKQFEATHQQLAAEVEALREYV